MGGVEGSLRSKLAYDFFAYLHARLCLHFIYPAKE